MPFTFRRAIRQNIGLSSGGTNFRILKVACCSAVGASPNDRIPYAVHQARWSFQ